MSAPRFTPGDWRIATHAIGEDICSVYGVENQPTEDGLGQSWVYIVHNQSIPETLAGRRQQQTANAHLIAAAPDLFAACEAAKAALIILGAGGSAYDTLVAAIAKAKGEVT